MDVAISLVTGLGLRLYFVQATFISSFIPPAILGLWEGVLVHQLSFNPPSMSSSPPLDHYLAFGLRLVVDLLITKSLARVILIGSWAALGSFISESAFPGPSSSTKSSRSSSSRKGRHRSSSKSIPVTSNVPSHIRVYETPETPPSVSLPTLHTNTPPRPTINTNNLQRTQPTQFPPPSPPSFFLNATPDISAVNSPPPILNPIPIRPTSSLSFYADHVKANSTPDVGPFNPRNSPLLPTPPDSTIRERTMTMDSRVDRLSTIDEITSQSAHASEHDEYEGRRHEEEEENAQAITTPGIPPLPVPNPTSEYVPQGDTNPTSTPVTRPPSAAPLPVPPVGWRASPGAGYNVTSSSDESDPLRTPGQYTYQLGHGGGSSLGGDVDELRTPPALNQPMEQTGNTDAGFERVLAIDTTSAARLGTNTPGPLSALSILGPPVPSAPLGSFMEALGATSISTTAKVVAENGGSARSTEKEKQKEESKQERPGTPSSDVESVLSAADREALKQHAEKYRIQAKQLEAERERLRKELGKAVDEKRPRDALFLRGDMQKADTKARKLHEKAARRYFAGENKTQQPDTIDVHGLKPAEALERTEHAFRQLLINGTTSLRVITGKGKHSVNGIPVLKNYLVAEMQKRQINCKEDTVNSGILILTLP